ncbi:proline/betaine transporter, partial [Escherichia coli]|nr:proline/betaine transporter [Escherichia coli]
MLKMKKVNTITLSNVTIIDDDKLRKAITSASLDNAMEWFDFGVFGFVAYALGKIFLPGPDPGVQMVATLAAFSVPFLV